MMSRPLSAACLLALFAGASADRLISIPTAIKVRSHTARLEGFFEPTKKSNVWGALTVGATPELEVELYGDRREGGPAMGTLNLTYQYIVPITDASPGIAFGVQDIADKTSLGRMYWLAFTIRQGLDGLYNSEVPLELSLGFGAGRRSGVFVGASLPFTYQFRLLAEHDTRRVSAGLEYRPTPVSAVRLLFREGATELGARYSIRF